MAGRPIALIAAAAIFFCGSAATAKDFGPGDLRVCGAKRCVPIENRNALRAFSAFYYGAGRAAVTRPPPLGAPAFEIRFRDRGAAGIVASARLDRARVYGLNCGRFRRGRWYRLPARITLEVRRLSAGLAPLHVTRRPPPPSC
jgi:hypothetical protein